MQVLFAAAELAPWIQVGGLGDVVGSLPAALRAEGIDARVCIPAHAHVLDAAPDPTLVGRFEIPHASGALPAEVHLTRLGEVPVYMIGGPPIPPNGLVYTGRMDEEGHRFAFFSLAVIELARRLRPFVDVLHAHDWHASLAVWALARRRRGDPALRDVTSVLTVHNLPYAGFGTEGALDGFSIGASDDERLPPHLRRVPLALGLVAADAITTVSPGYAREILGGEHGHGFETLLRARHEDLTGILNGLDVERWDPAHDTALEMPYSATDPSGRARCRTALARELGLPTELPIVGVISRLVAQKGIDVAVGALRRLGEGFAAVFLGEGEPHLEYETRALAKDLPGRVHARIGFDAALARRIYAGADMLLLPSRYEPCGMTQMIAMRYGCLPIACETGGLADTVADLDLDASPTGLLFPEPTAAGAAFALRRAFAARARGAIWEGMVENAMARDFSWRASARAYVAKYEEARRRTDPEARR
ncbi:MAG: glycogen/starch synthase [Myxococcales bacterium]|nr:glycogen/starch synthase [Myxococcales bacterium]